MRTLAGEGVGRCALDIEAAHDKQAPAVLFLGGLVDAGGDVEVLEIRPAEGASGGFERWDGHAVEFIAGGGVEAGNAAAVAKGDPQVAVGVDRHAIGRGIDGAGGAGAAQVAPLKGRKTCEYCGLQALCRIQELDSSILDDEAEREADA